MLKQTITKFWTLKILLSKMKLRKSFMLWRRNIILMLRKLMTRRQKKSLNRFQKLMRYCRIKKLRAITIQLAITSILGRIVHEDKLLIQVQVILVLTQMDLLVNTRRRLGLTQIEIIMTVAGQLMITSSMPITRLGTRRK